MLKKKLPYSLVVFLLACGLYLNTLGHEFTLDDSIVITENMYTTDGFSGWKGLLTKDTFHGFFKTDGKEQLVAGGRYRPLTPMIFAALYELVGQRPFFYHLFNVLLYGFCCMILFRFLRSLGSQAKLAKYEIVAFVASLIFAAHAIHTEVVANVKGADEILSTLAALFCLIQLIKYQSEKNSKNLTLALIAFLVSLLSKENTITLLAIAPLTLWMTNGKNKMSTIFLPTIFLTIIFVLYFIVRYLALGGAAIGDAPKELMNNPFLKYDGNALVSLGFSERMGTIFYSLLLYVKLLFVPHPLVHDYYPRHIPIVQLTSMWALISILLHVAAGVWSVLNIKRKSVLAFSILFYLLAMSITSNIFFPIGTTMSERFLFFPSIGFCFGLGYYLVQLREKNQLVGHVLIAAILILFSIKTILRNPAWKDNFTLFQTDVEYAPNSAKLQNAAAGSLITKYESLEAGPSKTAKMRKAIGHATEAIRIHPRYKNAHLLKGNGHLYVDEFEKAITAYDNALRLDPSYKEAKGNKQIAVRAAGRYYGETKGDLEKSLSFLKRAYEMDNKDPETLRLLGVAYGIKGTHTKAIEYFSKLIDEKPTNAEYWKLLGTAFHNNNQWEERDKVMAKAKELESQKNQE